MVTEEIKRVSYWDSEGDGDENGENNNGERRKEMVGGWMRVGESAQAQKILFIQSNTLIHTYISPVCLWLRKRIAVLCLFSINK